MSNPPADQPTTPGSLPENIGAMLREHYSELVAAPLPESILKIWRELDSRSPAKPAEDGHTDATGLREKQPAPRVQRRHDGDGGE